jgi:hypothetical protein
VGLELLLDFSGQQEPVLLLDVSIPQAPKLHLDVSIEHYRGLLSCTWTYLKNRSLCSSWT